MKDRNNERQFKKLFFFVHHGHCCCVRLCANVEIRIPTTMCARIHTQRQKTASGQGPVAISGENRTMLFSFSALVFHVGWCCPCDERSEYGKVYEHSCVYISSTSSRMSFNKLPTINKRKADTSTHTAVNRNCACSCKSARNIFWLVSFFTCCIFGCLVRGTFRCIEFAVYVRTLYQRALLTHQQLTDKTEANAFISDIIHVLFNVSAQ